MPPLFHHRIFVFIFTFLNYHSQKDYPGPVAYNLPASQDTSLNQNSL